MAAVEDKVARWVSILSLLVALLAVVVPYVQQQSQLQEQFTAELESLAAGSYKLTDTRHVDFGHVVQSRWRLTLSNVGTQKLSITRYVIFDVGPGRIMRYTGLDGGVLDTQGKPLPLPLILEGGETKVVELHIGAWVTPRVFSVLSAAAKDGQVPVAHANLLLARSGTDLYGNAVLLSESEGASIREWKDKKTKSPTYEIQFTSGRGNRFQITASP
jgi:hypothetical protein